MEYEEKEKDVVHSSSSPISKRHHDHKVTRNSKQATASTHISKRYRAKVPTEDAKLMEFLTLIKARKQVSKNEPLENDVSSNNDSDEEECYDSVEEEEETTDDEFYDAINLDVDDARNELCSKMVPEEGTTPQEILLDSTPYWLPNNQQRPSSITLDYRQEPTPVIGPTKGSLETTNDIDTDRRRLSSLMKDSLTLSTESLKPENTDLLNAVTCVVNSGQLPHSQHIDEPSAGMRCSSSERNLLVSEEDKITGGKLISSVSMTRLSWSTGTFESDYASIHSLKYSASFDDLRYNSDAELWLHPSKPCVWKSTDLEGRIITSTSLDDLEASRIGRSLVCTAFGLHGCEVKDWKETLSTLTQRLSSPNKTGMASRLGMTNSVPKAEVLQVFQAVKHSFFTLFELFDDEDYTERILALTNEMKPVSPFSQDTDDFIQTLVLNYIQKIGRSSLIDLTKVQKFCAIFGRHLLPCWTKVLIHGYIQGISIVDAAIDFVEAASTSKHETKEAVPSTPLADATEVISNSPTCRITDPKATIESGINVPPGRYSISENASIGTSEMSGTKGEVGNYQNVLEQVDLAEAGKREAVDEGIVKGRTRNIRKPNKYTPAAYETKQQCQGKGDRVGENLGRTRYCCGRFLVGAEMIECSGGTKCSNDIFGHVYKALEARTGMESASTQAINATSENPEIQAFMRSAYNKFDTGFGMLLLKLIEDLPHMGYNSVELQKFEILRRIIYKSPYFEARNSNITAAAEPLIEPRLDINPAQNPLRQMATSELIEKIHVFLKIRIAIEGAADQAAAVAANFPAIELVMREAHTIYDSVFCQIMEKFTLPLKYRMLNATQARELANLDALMKNSSYFKAFQNFHEMFRTT